LRFGEFLRERRAISDEQWLDAVADHFAAGGSFGATVARRGFLSTDEVERWADEYHALGLSQGPTLDRQRQRGREKDSQ
jgi:hypothetical protein